MPLAAYGSFVHGQMAVFTLNNICFWRGSKHSLNLAQHSKLLFVWTALESRLLATQASQIDLAEARIRFQGESSHIMAF